MHILVSPLETTSHFIPTSFPSPSPWPFHVPHAEGLLRSWSRCFLYDTSVEIAKKNGKKLGLKLKHIPP